MMTQLKDWTSVATQLVVIIGLFCIVYNNIYSVNRIENKDLPRLEHKIDQVNEQLNKKIDKVESELIVENDQLHSRITQNKLEHDRYYIKINEAVAAIREWVAKLERKM